MKIEYFGRLPVPEPETKVHAHIGNGVGFLKIPYKDQKITEITKDIPYKIGGRFYINPSDGTVGVINDGYEIDVRQKDGVIEIKITSFDPIDRKLIEFLANEFFLNL